MSDETLVIARTDALAVEGFERALERAALYQEAGADVLFVEAPQTMDQLQAIVRALGAATPLVANMVEGGKTPILTRQQLADIGFKLVISPGSIVRAFAHLANSFLAGLKADGSTARFRDQMLDFAQINALLGLPELLQESGRYEAAPRQAAE
jgi:2-methylisocitrate lyase-like PEP mutase family enzyme